MKNFLSLKLLRQIKFSRDGDCQYLDSLSIDGGAMSFLRITKMLLFLLITEMKIKTDQEEIIEAFVGDGFIEFLNNEALIVCVSLSFLDEIDKRRAEEAKIRAEEELRHKSEAR